ncbi:MAG TPA: cytochrome P450, partial [Paracoccaceae bacterium]|nr:cytochrome P450 [Paracoccaceae bacterium]
MPGDENLSHIPGPPVPRHIGHTLAIVKDAYGTQQDFLRRYGDVYKVKTLGEWRVNLCGPEAMERVLLDRDQTFSSTGGWDLISRLFSGGLMLQDFDEHRQNRRIMQSAFRAQALQDYMARMQHALSDLIDAWPKDKSFDVYPAIKELTLRLGCAVFMGLPVDSPLARDLNAAFTAEIRAAVSIVRNPVPFTPMWRGVRGRAFLRRTFQELVPQRRARPSTDFFSQMCIAKDE